MEKLVRVGVATLIFKDESILFGLRCGSHGKDQWCFPGGHLEFGETPEECAKRETYEETSLIIPEVKLGPWTNDYFSESKHYITLFVIAHYAGGAVKLKEKNKFKEWRWLPFNQPPEPLFLSIETLFKDHSVKDFLCF